MTHTVLVTGASRGIGLEFVHQYAQAKWNVIACSRQPEEAKNLEALSTAYPTIKIVKLDVSNDDEVQHLSRTLSGVPIDILINNAGILNKDHFSVETVTTEEMLEVFLTNAIAPLQIAKVLFPNLMSGKLKVLANISSRLGSITHNSQKIELATKNRHRVYYPYRASKVALNMLMKTLSLEWHSSGIRVLLLHPGVVKTDMGGPNAPIDVKTSVANLRKVISEKSPLEDAMYYTHEGIELPW